MDQILLQRTRYVLRSRVRQVQTCPNAMFVSSCRHLLEWIANHPILSPITLQLGNVEGDFKERIDQTFKEAPDARGGYDPGRYNAKSAKEHPAVCLKLVQAIVQIGEIPPEKEQFLIRNFAEYLNGDDRVNYDDAVTVLRDVAIDGLYEYLDEQIDTRNAIYGILLKFKQRSEWFRKDRLRKMANEGIEGKTGERSLALELQEYVFDQGVEFFIEPSSISGEVDIILRTSEGRYIIIDAKYIPETANRSTIRDKLSYGFHQVLRYCVDYNEPEGFLVTFVETSKKIRLELQNQDGIPFVKIGGKVIYYLELNIAELPSASKSGKAQEVFLTLDELIHIADDTEDN